MLVAAMGYLPTADLFQRPGRWVSSASRLVSELMGIARATPVRLASNLGPIRYSSSHWREPPILSLGGHTVCKDGHGALKLGGKYMYSVQ